MVALDSSGILKEQDEHRVVASENAACNKQATIS